MKPFKAMKSGISGVWEWAMLIFNLLKNSPEIIKMFEDFMDLIKNLTGSKGDDEVDQVKKVKAKAGQLGKKLALRRTDLHDQK